MDKNNNMISGLFKSGFILTGIAILIAAFALIFLNIYDLDYLSSISTNSSNDSTFLGDAVVSHILGILAAIFLIIVASIVIKRSNDYKYSKIGRLGIMVMLSFLFLGIADIIIGSGFLDKHDIDYNKTIGNFDFTLGVILIVGAILLAAALLIASNNNKTYTFIASIIGIIASILIFYSITAVPHVLSKFLSYSGYTAFEKNMYISLFIPSHSLFFINFFMSWEYLGLIAGIILAVAFILKYFDVLEAKLISLIYIAALAIFSIGEIITGAIILTTHALTSFSKSNPLYEFITALPKGSSYVSTYKIFQTMALITGIIVLISGVLLISYSSLHIFSIMKGNKTAGNTENKEVEK